MTQERIIVDRTTTWHALGKDVSECKNVAQVLEKSRLNYEVEKCLVYADVGGGIQVPYEYRDDTGRYVEIPNRCVTARMSDGHLYDVVSDKYEVVQNCDAFDFVNYMSDDLQFEKAGETDSGMVFIIGKLPEVNILGDSFVPHVIFRNGFSGKIKISAAICPLRMVCQNQFNFAFSGAQNTINIRHTSNASIKLQEAKETLKISADYMAKLSQEAEKYAGIHFNKFQVNRIINELFPMGDAENMNPYKRNRLEAAKAEFINAYNTDDNQNFKGTAWGLINAYTDFMTHKIPVGPSQTKEENKFINVTFGKNMNNIINMIKAVA